MSSNENKPDPTDGEVDKKKLKPCCACPETREPRDKWYVYTYSII